MHLLSLVTSLGHNGLNSVPVRRGADLLRHELGASQWVVILAARSSRTPVLKRRGYLSLLRRDHRAALIRLSASVHPLAVEQLRRRSPLIPREWRICRFCAQRNTVEDETRTFLRRSGLVLAEPRKHFTAQIVSVCRELRISMAVLPLWFLASGTPPPSG